MLESIVNYSLMCVTAKRKQNMRKQVTGGSLEGLQQHLILASSSPAVPCVLSDSCRATYSFMGGLTFDPSMPCPVTGSLITKQTQYSTRPINNTAIMWLTSKIYSNQTIKILIIHWAITLGEALPFSTPS